MSETGRYTRGTGVVTPLDALPALTRWIRPFFHSVATQEPAAAPQIAPVSGSPLATTAVRAAAVRLPRSQTGCFSSTATPLPNHDYYLQLTYELR